MPPQIAQVVVGLPVEGHFDYRIPSDMSSSVQVGMRVYVPFGNRKLVGVVIGLAERSPFKKLKSILAALDNVPIFDPVDLELAQEFAGYYGCSRGEAVETCLPAALRKKTLLQLSSVPSLPPPAAKGSGSFILCHDQGLTERWPFIIETIRKTLAQGQRVLFLVPEISLIENIVGILESGLNVSCGVLDRQLPPKQELAAWMKAREGQFPVVMGSRSAVFAPVPSLGLIVVYDEENSSYKQEQSPFYHVRDVAQMRARKTGSSLLFVSSAPSVELWQQVKKQKGVVKTFAAGPLGVLQVIDLANYKPRQRSSISLPLFNLILETLTTHGKVLLILNRRGFSTTTRCTQCGHAMRCPRCDTNLSYLYSKKQLMCHLCRSAQELPQFCPQCRGAYLRYLGMGIEKMESDLARLFPQARIRKFDRETDDLPESTDIVIATHAILKRLDRMRPQVTGVLDIDTDLGRMDFRAGQKVFSLLVSLRQRTAGKVAVQTYHPDHDAIRAAQRMDAQGFYAKEIALRKDAGLPPFQRLIAVGLRGVDKDAVFEQAKNFYETLKTQKPDAFELLDPQPDILPKLRDKYRFTIMLKGPSVKSMMRWLKTTIKTLKRKKDVIVTLNVDP